MGKGTLEGYPCIFAQGPPSSKFPSYATGCIVGEHQRISITFETRFAKLAINTTLYEITSHFSIIISILHINVSYINGES